MPSMTTAVKEPKRDRRKRKPGLLAQAIYDSILGNIVTGELKQGEFLSEPKLAAKFRTSRTPIREACIRLHYEGYLDTAPHRGYVVKGMTVDDFRELFHLRQILEPEAAALAASNPQGRSLLKSRLPRPEEYPRVDGHEHSYEVFHRLSEVECRIHTSIAEASGNKRLAKWVNDLMNQYRRFYYPVPPKASETEVTIAEHKNIAEAIESQDANRARQLMLEHVNNGAMKILHRIATGFSGRGYS